MKSLILTNEYPPHIYGGAGIHVQSLTKELSRLCDVDVRCFGEQSIRRGNPLISGKTSDTASYTSPKALRSVFAALENCIQFNTQAVDADVVHLHTWYSHFGGILAHLNYGLPMVLTVHSLEPLRPWKREQLGGGYDFTLWLEKTAIEMADAVIAVSRETKHDILRLFDVPENRVPVIHNGIDPDEYQPTFDEAILKKHGIDPAIPFVLFVGRITRQKGIVHLVNAIQFLDPGTQVVLCAGAPDTPEIAVEMENAVAAARETSDCRIVWIKEMISTPEKIVLYSHARVFCCPSIYEPFGIINLEAMACETPVLASDVGGMKEIIVPGSTGLLVPVRQQSESPYEVIHPHTFARDLAAGINQLMGDPELCRKMGTAGRDRIMEKFRWTEIARSTLRLYEEVCSPAIT